LLALNAAAEGSGIVVSTPQLAASHFEAGTLIAPFALELPIDSAYFVASTKAALKRDGVARFWDWLHAEASGAATALGA
jgi:LysR family glycine cleavage system transcriptional activator